MQKMNFINLLPNSYFGYFGHVWLFPSKTMPTNANFDVYLPVKNQLLF